MKKTDNIEFSKTDILYMINRLKAAIELINDNKSHMAIAKLLADISALKGMLKGG